MSRHSLTAKNPGHDVVVGWDPPLETFFLTVQMKSAFRSLCDEDEDLTIAWHGWAQGEVPTVERLVALTEAYAEIPMDLRLRLAAERIANIGMREEEDRRSSRILRDIEAAEPDQVKRLALLQRFPLTPRDPSAWTRLLSGLR